MRKPKNYVNFVVVIATASSAALWSNHGQANAPPSRYTITNGIVNDGLTKLSWEQAVSATAYTNSDAATRCATLNLDGSGWRLPSMKELLTIVDEKRYKPAVDPAIFPDTPAARFWTSSERMNTSSHWIVDFDLGYSSYSSNSSLVRCVR